ncbi:MAG: porin family protein [Candidatus Nitrotoga sp.]
MKKIAAVALLSAFIAAPVAAEDMHMYIGANVGSAQIDATGFDASTAFSVLAGHKFNSNFAAEVAYVNFGSVDVAPAGSTVKSSAMSLSGVGSFPLNDQFSLFGKLGLASTTVKGTGFPSESNTGVTYGVGAQFDFDQQFAIRAGWDMYKIGDVNEEDEDVMSLGAIFTF